MPFFRSLLCTLLTVAASFSAMASDSLVGTWKLGGVTATSADGSVDREPYGAGPAGLLTYTADGYMQVILTFAERPEVEGSWRDATTEQLAAAFSTGMAYAGRYSYADGVVTHHIEVATNPSRVGTALPRTVSHHGDAITLTPPTLEVDGAAVTYALTWKRVD